MFIFLINDLENIPDEVKYYPSPPPFLFLVSFLSLPP